MNVILVTGASSEIGEAVVNRLAERNLNLLLVARNAQKLEEQCTKLKNVFGIHAEFIAADLIKNDTAQKISNEMQKRELEVTMLINNAVLVREANFQRLHWKQN